MNDNKAKQPVSTEPYKGVRDFYPEDMAIQKHIFSGMRTTVESFGYVEYNASVLEPTELYRSKSSDEIVNEQTYSFKDRGERDVTLRPEMTPTVARMIAGRRRDISFPARWYSIPNVFRYEQPQRGRLREHWQLNVDLFGSTDIEADIEILTVAHSILKDLGAKDSDFVIKLNNRVAIRNAIQADLTDDDVRRYLSLVDKRGKIGEEQFKLEVTKAFNRYIEYKADVPDAHTEKIIKMLEKRGITNVEFDPYIIRGFTYYTGMVFEVFDTDPQNKRSIFGGGRYDNLTAHFGGDSVPAVGFGMGDVTTRDFLETHNLLPEYSSTSDLFIATIGDTKEYAAKLAQDLRKIGLRVSINLTDKKIGDQIKSADKNRIPYVLTIGEDEVKNQEFKVKELVSGTETSCSSVEEIVNTIQK